MDAGQGRRSPFAFRLFVTLGWLVVIGAAFTLGYLLSGHDANEAAIRIQALQTERDRLSESLAEERDAHVRLERSHMIDREAKRAAQEQLAELQGERLRLAKQVAYLQGLIREGETGVVEVREFLVTEADEPHTFRYRFTMNQLIPNFGHSEGVARIKVALMRDGERSVEPVSALQGSSAGKHDFAFDHFQSFEGTIVLPPGAEPREVIVDIEPENNNLMQSSESFAWQAQGGDATSLLPIVGGDRKE